MPIGCVDELDDWLESWEELDWHESRDFVVRAKVDENDLDGLRTKFGDDRVFPDPDITALPVGDDPAHGSVDDVRGRLGVDGLAAKGLTGEGTSIAIVDTGINLAWLRGRGFEARMADVQWTPPDAWPAHDGEHPVGHGTMCAYDALAVAGGAMLRDYPLLVSPPGGAWAWGLLSNVLSAYAGMVARWEWPGGYDGLVVANGWMLDAGGGDTAAEHPAGPVEDVLPLLGRMVGLLERSGVDILFGMVDGPLGSRAVDLGTHGIHVAGIRVDEDVADGRVASALRTGGVADLAAFSGFVGSEANGPQRPDGGAAAACAVAAGTVAAVRTAARAREEPHTRVPRARDLAAYLAEGIIDPRGVVVARLDD